MSYSFALRAASAALALAAVEAKFDEIVSQQPAHAADKPLVMANAKNAIEFLAVDETRDISVSGNGYISWFGNTEQDGLQYSAVSVSISAALAPRDPA